MPFYQETLQRADKESGHYRRLALKVNADAIFYTMATNEGKRRCQN
ncbi:MAG: hypothetical protein ACRC46_13385 [Thermoguttaceae bacterium]